MNSDLQPPSGYPQLLQELKARIRTAQVRAALAVNRELVLLYWSIGQDLSRCFTEEGWGTKINENLSNDLQCAFPGVEGFSPRNLRYMRSVAEAWPDREIVQQLVAKLPWGHNLQVLDRVKDRPTREWYLRAALENGWSRNVLAHMIRPICTGGKGRGRATSSARFHLPARTWRTRSFVTHTTSNS